MIRTKRLRSIAAAAAMAAAVPLSSHAAPFASRLAVSGTNVSFILNEPADVLAYRLNGAGPLIPLDGTSKGAKSFVLNSPTDTFDIHVNKVDTVGYSITTGGTVAAITNGLSQASDEGGYRLISDNANLLTRFNSPRGVSVSNNPSAANFGVAYVSNSAAGSTAAPVRALGDGLYALNADQSDAYGYGNTAQDPGNSFDTIAASGNSAFRTTVAADGQVYVTDFSDANGNVYFVNQNMTAGGAVLTSPGGTPSGTPPQLAVGKTHGSVTSVYVEGSIAAGNLVVYTIDEDLTSSIALGSGANNDRNSLWRYDIGAGPLASGVAPVKINVTNPLINDATSDMDRGADGKFYLAQYRANGTEAGVVVLNADGTVAYDSLSASRTLLGNPTAADILRQVQGMAVSVDQKWMALILNNSDVAVVPMIAGIPDLANRRVVNTGTDVNSGRDIAFDAAGNIHYLSSGQAQYRVLSPGGTTFATTSWNGSSASFSISAVPEPATLGLAAVAFVAAIGTMRRRA